MQAHPAARADEEHQAGRALGVVGEVVRAAGPERGVHHEPGLAEQGPAGLGQRLAVDQGGLAFVDRHGALAAVGAAGVLHDLAQRLAQHRAVGRVQRPQRAAGGGGGGDHVRRPPGLELADRHGRRVGGVDAPADDLLQGQHHLAEHGHRVDGLVRIARVAAYALDPDLEAVGGRVHRAGRRGDRTGRHLVLQVHADDRVRLLRRELRRRRDVPRAGWVALLARLQHGEQGRGQAVRGRHVAGRAPERGQGREVHVVPARVHGAGRAGPGHPGLLPDRERIQLGPDRDARAVGRADAHDPAGPGDGGRVRGAERRRDRGRGAVLGPGQLRAGVQFAAQPHRAGDLAVQRGPQRRGRPRAGHGAASRYTRRALAAPIRCPARSASAADQAPSVTNAPVTRARSRRNPVAPR